VIHKEYIQTYIVSSLGPDEFGVVPWEYYSSEPLVLRIVAGPDNVWHISRDHMAVALIAPDGLYGEGDIQIACDGEWVRVYLTSPEGTAQLRMIKQDMVAFVNKTVEIVAPESEDEIVLADLNDTLAIILSEV
jgi:hypothetical protein